MMEKLDEKLKENQPKINIANPLVQVEQKEENQIKITAKNESEAAAKPLIWDSGSTLYDSFELKSFERQLDSAIHSRTLSMPHLSDHPPGPPPSQPQPMSKKPSKISRSFHKLLRSVFKFKAQNSNRNPLFTAKEKQVQAAQDGFYVVYDGSRVLSTIPEAPEFDSLSPDINSLARRTASDRFTFTSIGISCA